jgi:hypothetical protein
MYAIFIIQIQRELLRFKTTVLKRMTWGMLDYMLCWQSQRLYNCFLRHLSTIHVNPKSALHISHKGLLAYFTKQVTLNQNFCGICFLRYFGYIVGCKYCTFKIGLFMFLLLQLQLLLSPIISNNTNHPRRNLLTSSHRKWRLRRKFGISQYLQISATALTRPIKGKR